MIAGVCGGPGTFFRIRPFWLRLLFVILLQGGLAGLLPYVILWPVIPKQR